MYPPRHNGKTREELTAELLESLMSARITYEALSSEYQAGRELVEDAGANADGIDKFREVRGVHTKMRIALSRYKQALQRFNDLVVRGIVQD